MDVAGEQGENGRSRFFILALVKGINYYQSWDASSLERISNELLHLRTERLPSGIRDCSQDLEQLLSEKWISIGELESQCGEDRLKIAPVHVVS